MKRFRILLAMSILSMAMLGCNNKPSQTPAPSFSAKPESVTGNVDNQLYFKFLSWENGTKVLVVDDFANDTERGADGKEFVHRHSGEQIRSDPGYHCKTTIMQHDGNKEIYNWEVSTNDGAAWKFSINGSEKLLEKGKVVMVRTQKAGEAASIQSIDQLDLNLDELDATQNACKEFCKKHFLKN